MNTTKTLNRWMIALHLLVAVLLVGCSSKSSRVDRYISNADDRFSSGDYASAEIEYLNAIKLDHELHHAVARLGVIYFDQGRLRQAAPHLRRAVQLDPDNLEVAYRLALLYLASGDAAAAKASSLGILETDPQNRHAPIILVTSLGIEHNQASEQIQQTLEAFEAGAPDNPSYQVAQAIRLARLERMDEAKQAVQQALEIDPHAAYAHSTFAKIYAAEGHDDTIEAALSAAAKDTPVRSPFRLELIQFYLQGYDIEKGRSHLTEMLEAAPNLVPALVLLARVEQADNDVEGALKTIHSILYLDPTNHDGLIMKAACLRRLDNAVEAAPLLSDLVKLYPNSHLAYFELAQTHAVLNQSKQASQSLLQALHLKPDFHQARALLSLIQLNSGDYGRSTINLKQLLKSNPDDPNIQMQLASSLQGQGNIEAALELYQGLEASDPTNAQVSYLKGNAYLQLNDIANAVAAFKQSLQRDPDYMPALERLIYYYLSEKRFSDAAAQIDSRIHTSPENPELHMLQAIIRAAQDDNDSAKNALFQAIELKPDYRNAHFMLAQLYLKDDELDKACSHLEAIITNHPRDIPARTAISQIYEKQLKWDRARDHYEKILQVNPNAVIALNNLAYLYSTVFDDLDHAHALAKKARKIYPNHPLIADTLGWIKHLQGDYNFAYLLLKESSEQLSDQPEIRYHLGSTYYMLGDEVKARQIFETLLASAPSFKQKANIEQRLATLNIDSADQTNLTPLKQILAKNPNDPVALIKLAKIYEHMGNIDEAFACYDLILASNASHLAALTGKARLLSVSDEPALALKFARKMYALRPNDPAIAGEIGRIAFLGGDHLWSVSLLEEAVKSLHKDPELNYYLAEALFAVGRITTAKTFLNQSDAEHARELSLFLAMVDPWTHQAIDFEAAHLLAHASNNPLASAWITALSAKAISASQGITAFEQLLYRFSEFIPAKRDLAILYAMSDQNHADAYQLAREASRTLSNDSELTLALGILELKRGNFKRAVALLAAENANTSSSAIIQFYWGMARLHTGNSAESLSSFKKALELGLSGAQADEAQQAIHQIEVDAPF